MDNYFNYSYYDEEGKYIIILHPNAPKETIERYSKICDEVKFKE